MTFSVTFYDNYCFSNLTQKPYDHVKFIFHLSKPLPPIPPANPHRFVNYQRWDESVYESSTPLDGLEKVKWENKNYQEIHVFRLPVRVRCKRNNYHYGDYSLGEVVMVDLKGNQYLVDCGAHNDRQRGRCSDEECTNLYLNMIDGVGDITVWDGNKSLIHLFRLVESVGESFCESKYWFDQDDLRIDNNWSNWIPANDNYYYQLFDFLKVCRTLSTSNSPMAGWSCHLLKIIFDIWYDRYLSSREIQAVMAYVNLGIKSKHWKKTDFLFFFFEWTPPSLKIK